MSEHVVAEADDLDDGDHVVVDVDGTEVGVFRVDGEYRAYLNWCPHQSGPVCEGGLTGTRESTFDPEELSTTVEWTREGRVLNCPWHGWEFDVETGESLSREKVQLRSIPLRVEDGQVVVSL